MFVSEMIDQLRDLLNETADEEVSFAIKRRWLNVAIRRLWPDVYRVVEYTGITAPAADATTFDFTLPAALADGHVLSVESEVTPGAGDYLRFEHYDIIQGDEDQTSVFRYLSLPAEGSALRIRYTAPIPTIVATSYANAQSETWTGPDEAIDAPVAYAMSMIWERRLEDRMNFKRYSTTQATNAVSDADIAATARGWMDQYVVERERLQRPLPIVKD